MEITIIAVGKLSQIYRTLQIDLVKRLKDVRILEIRESNRLEEMKEILRKLESKDCFTVLCDAKGKEMTSQEFSNFLKDVIQSKDVCFIIGGPAGVEKSLLKNKVNLELSLSRMTFNH